MICRIEKENLIESVLRKAIAVIVVAAFLFPLISPQVFAASSISVSGGDSVKGGDTFTVNVTYSGTNIGRVDGQMTYDTDKLTYISGGSSSGNSGYIQLKRAGTGESISFNIKFQALTDGNTSLSITTNEMYTLDEEAMDTPSASKTIKISGNVSSDQKITEERSSDEPVEASEPEGVDEKGDEDIDDEDAVSANTVLIVSAAVLLVIICIISAILISRRRKFKKQKKEPERKDDENNDSWDSWDGIDDDF